MKRIKGKPHWFRKVINGKNYDYYVRKIKIEDKTFTISAKSKEDYLNKLEIKKEELKSGASELADRNMTIKDASKYYLSESENYASGTYIRRERYLRLYILPEFKDMKVKDIRNSHVKKFYNQILESKGLSLVTATHKVLNSLFETLIENEMAITKNPISRGLVKSIKNKVNRLNIENSVTKDIEELDTEEISYILREVKGTKEEIVYHFQILHGLRIAEALAVTFDNVDLENNEINVNQQVVSTSKSKTKGTRFESDNYNQIAPTKTISSNRVVPLSPPTRELIVRLLESRSDQESQGLIYKTANDSVCGTDNWNKRHHRPLMDKLGLNIRTHSLRKFFGSFHINNRTPIQQVSAWLGHSDIATTYKHYAKIIKDSDLDNKWLTAQLVA
tara:strand:+ start:640 stop:1809 length:1170 start_codon:yes stop_codon:yes gene_type:complete